MENQTPQPVSTDTPSELPSPPRQPASPQPKPVYATPSSVKILILLLILALIGMAGLAGYFWQKTKMVPVRTVQTTQQFPPTPIPTPTVNPTLAWRMYTNTKLGISFQYPQEINILRDTMDKTATEGALETKIGVNQDRYAFDSFVLYVAKSSDTLAQYVGKFGNTTPAPVTKTIGAFTVTQWLGSYKNAPTMYESFASGGFIYNFGLVAPKNITTFESANGKILDRILTSVTLLNTTSTPARCTSTVLKLTVPIPSGWSCDTNDDAYWLTLKSDLFDINMSTLGRGPYCGDGGDDSGACKETGYYKGKTYGLTLFTYNGEDGELFGSYAIGEKPWVSVKYTNMEKQKLTASQKQELVTVLNSVTTIPEK